MSNNIAVKQAKKDESQTPGGGKKPSSQRPPEQTLRCPRCDSTNTKFCYYNNYNLTQPRYFCKTCRRYWTKGGALRNIPIGGGCRKNKKTKSCTSKFVIGDSSSGVVNSPAVMGFQINGLNSNYPQTNLPFMNLDPLGFSNNNPRGDHHDQNQESFQEMGSFAYSNLHHNNSLSSSIQTLSSLNQDLHWKLQQQRLAMMFGENQHHHQQQHQRQNQKETGLQPILFQNLEVPSRKEVSSGGGDGGGVGGLATEWFFDNHYAPVNMGSVSGGNDQNGDGGNWNGIQTWSNMNHYQM